MEILSLQRKWQCNTKTLWCQGRQCVVAYFYYCIKGLRAKKSFETQIITIYCIFVSHRPEYMASHFKAELHSSFIELDLGFYTKRRWLLCIKYWGPNITNLTRTQSLLLSAFSFWKLFSIVCTWFFTFWHMHLHLFVSPQCEDTCQSLPVPPERTVNFIACWIPGQVWLVCPADSPQGPRSACLGHTATPQLNYSSTLWPPPAFHDCSQC